MSTTQAVQHDPSNPQASPAANTQPSASAIPPSNTTDTQNLPIVNLAQDQVLALLKTLPQLYRAQGDAKDSVAAETLSNLSQSAPPYHQLPPGMPMYQHYPGMDPGPSSHPRGPPSLGNVTQLPAASGQPMPANEGEGQQDEGSDGQDSPGSQDPDKPKSSSGRRNGRSAAMSNDEWARQRKDNHKEVERRRRGNINEGINELGRIVPNGSGEKAKGAILARAVQYIHHLKENEARNIEKWTLEKLLMDQAMGDLQAQLEEMKRLWEDERVARQRTESELEVLKGLRAQGVGASGSGAAPDGKTSPKRTAEDMEEPAGQDGETAEVKEERVKRQRVE